MGGSSLFGGGGGGREEVVAAGEAEDTAGAALVLEGQPVFLEMAVLPMVDVDLVWGALADYHASALGQPTGYGLDLTQEEAFDAWSRTTLGLDGYLRAISPEAAERVLASATDFAEYQESLAGIDSVFLSAFSSAGRSEAAAPSLEHAGWVLDQFGMPSTPGGGAAQTFVNDVRGNSASLVGHDSLAAKLEATHGNPGQVLDVLARAGVGAVADVSRSVIPGSGKYVRDGGNAIVSAGEGAAVGAVVGGVLGPVGATVGGVLGAIVGFFGSLLSSGTSKDASKGEAVPVSPPAPVTDKDGNTTKAAPNGTTAQGRPAAGTSTPPPPHPPGPRASEVHCPRREDDMSPDLVLLGWGREFTLMPTVGLYGPGMDAVLSGLGSSVNLPAAAQVSWGGTFESAGFLGDAISGDQAASIRPGFARVVDRGLYEKTVRVGYRSGLAQALVLYADPSATVYDALAEWRSGGPGRRAVIGEP